MLTTRALTRSEIARIWTTDRGEVIDRVYHLENGALVLRPEHHDMRGWLPGTAERATPTLLECFDRGGWFCGLFDGMRLAGVAVLESRLIGRHGDRLQLVFLHVDRAYRNQGWGHHLFEMARAEARERGAQWMYISATPSENTIRFYLQQGCEVTAELDPELFAEEPEDIHLECRV